jgi:F420-0:gamma-glutamyl ligase-like protein
MPADVTFLAPKTLRTVDDLLGAAAKLNLTTAILLSEQDDGGLVVLSTADVTVAQGNWLADRFKKELLR